MALLKLRLLMGQQILVINSGSSSIKLSLFKAKRPLERLLDAHFKGINAKHQSLEIVTSRGRQTKASQGIANHHTALRYCLDAIVEHGFSTSDLLGIGHRVVHGGNKFTESVRITPSVIVKLDKLSDLAPLHNPPCVEAIKSAFDYFKKIPQFAVFDTTFHQTLPPYASHYGLPAALAKKHAIKRYGFHGISHAYLSATYAKLVNKSRNSKIITLHLGSGCSAAAIKGGISIDTSMGFTPLEGLLMSTRTGDIDPSVLEFLSLHEKKSPREVLQMFNFDSGLLGISKKTSDMKALLEISKKDRHARLAIEMFCYRILKYIGAYFTVLGGLDAIIFSGGVGENASSIRLQITSKLGGFGVSIDVGKNKKAVHLSPGDVHKISSHQSLVDVYVIGTDENGLIAQEVFINLS